MTSYIDRDLIRAYLLTFITLVAFVQVGYFVSVLLEQRSYLFGGGESKLGWVIMLYFSQLPRQAAYTIPVATSLSVLWVFTTKARNNEVLAYFVGGVSPQRLARPMIIMGGIFSVICFLTIEYVANPSDRYAYRLERINIQGRSEETLTREKDVFQKGHGNRFFAIREFNPSEDTMIMPIIIDMGENWNRPVWRLDAASAHRIQSDASSEWVFQNAVFRHWDENGQIDTYREGKELAESQLGVKLEDELSAYLREQFKPDQMGVKQLVDYIHVFREQGKATFKLEAYLHFNFAIPLGSLVLAVLMCGHILRPSSTGLAVGFGGGLFIIACYFFVLITFNTFAKSGRLDPVVAAYLPNLVGLVIGVWLLSRYRAAS